jgi:hypothetical protein
MDWLGTWCRWWWVYLAKVSDLEGVEEAIGFVVSNSFWWKE